MHINSPFNKFNLPGYLFIALAFFITGCSKDKRPEPDFVLNYQTTNGSYAESSAYRVSKTETHQLEPSASVGWTPAPQSDSVLLKYTSTLKDKTGKPIVALTISKIFDGSKLDFLQNGTPVLKNSDDFYNLFKKGMVSITCAASPDIHYEGLDISLHDTTYYIFQDASGFNLHLSIPAYQDSANSFEITNASSDLNFMSLVGPGIIPQGTVRASVVTIKFKCKLYNVNEPHSTLTLTNGIFQGLFLDR